MELLQSPELFERIASDLAALGYVGEELNKQLLYIAASSRKMADPISVVILSQSASGKSLLVEIGATAHAARGGGGRLKPLRPGAELHR